MRIKLKKTKQKELILKAKVGKTWETLAKELSLNAQYLYSDLKNEQRLLSEENYRQLCEIAEQDYDKYIIKRLSNNWGQSKGGINSIGSTKKLPKIEFNEKFAEFIGAVLGDGHIGYLKVKKQKRHIGVYVIRIAGDLIKDKEYHLNYLKPLGEKLFGLKAKEIRNKKQNERFLDFHSKELVELFISMNIQPGNKIKNQSTIPSWIIQENKFLNPCLRGLIDTDGCIHRMSKRDFNLLRINFTNHNKTLLKDTRESFIKLGFNPSKIISNAKFFISRQTEIKKYMKEIGFKNSKHLKRFKEFSPVR